MVVTSISPSIFLIVAVLLFPTSSSNFASTDDDNYDIFTNSWAVQINGGHDLADRIAASHGFINKGQIGSLSDHYHFIHLDSPTRSRRTVHHIHSQLSSEKEVIYSEQQRLLKRHKRDYIAPVDPFWSKQWYMHRSNLDMNVKPVWELGITGKNAVISILDDGIEHTHPDLQENYDSEASFDFNSHDSDPFPRYDFTNENKHGTRCAGEVSAAKNDVCTLGVAYQSRIGGVRMLDGDVTDAIEASSLSLNPQHIDIYSSSWGPDDDGMTVDGPGKLARKAFFNGITQGRGGLGSLFVWASGNGGASQDSCNCDGYAVSPYTLSISAVSENEKFPWYAEECSSTIASTYSSGSSSERQVISTDLHHKCTTRHTGTSASAPMAAGLLALLLEVNSSLSWRDIQYIVIYSSNHNIPKDSNWAKNGAGLTFSHKFGFGLMDASAMVNRARYWNNVPERRNCTINISTPNNRMITADSPLEVKISVSKDRDCPIIGYLEHVQAHLSISVHKGGRGRLTISLQSPQNTKSILLPFRNRDKKNKNFVSWPFMTVFSWGENPIGEWLLKIEAKDPAEATLENGQLILYGVETRPRIIRDIPEKCSDQCKSGCAKAGPRFCDSCKQYRVLTTLECVEACPSGTYLDETTCRPCIDNCVVCTNSSVCIQCLPGSLKVSQGACLKSCPTSTYIALQNNTCYECHSSCMECSGPSPYNCTQCLSAQYHLTEGACVLITNCSPGNFFDSRAFECKLCDESCAECNGREASDCSACYPGHVFSDGHCVPSLLSCGKGEYFSTETSSCAICPPGCNQCTDSVSCVMCHGGYFLHTSQVGQSAENKKLCVKSCPPGFYGDSAGKVCVDCSPFCKTCSSIDFCITCAKQDIAALDGVCPQPCADREFYDVTTNKCRSCSGHCKTCTSETKCTKCTDESLFLSMNGSCTEACPSNTVADIENHFCMSTECHESCLTCSGPEPDQCLSCSSDRIFNPANRVCVDSCPDGKVLVEDSQDTCIDCSSDCLTCTGVTDSDCLSCKDTALYLDDHSCVTSCRSGTFAKNGFCLSCPSGCTQCTNSTHCDKCSSNYVLHSRSNKCLTNCPAGFHEVDHTCQPCVIKVGCLPSPSSHDNNVDSSDSEPSPRLNVTLLLFIIILSLLIVILTVVMLVWKREAVSNFFVNKKGKYRVLYTAPDSLDVRVNGTVGLEEIDDTTDSETEVFTNY